MDLERGIGVRAPSIYFRERASDFVWVPHAKRMHHVRIDLKITFFSLLPPQIPPVPTVFNSGSAPVLDPGV